MFSVHGMSVHVHTAFIATRAWLTYGVRSFSKSSGAQRTQKPFGALAQLPHVPSINELIQVGTTRANRLLHDKFISGGKAKTMDHALRKLDVFVDYALYRIKRCLVAAPLNASQLHPFERTVVGLSLGPEKISKEEKLQIMLSVKSSRKGSIALEHHVESGLREYRNILQALQKVYSNVESLRQKHCAIIKKCQTKVDVVNSDLEAYTSLKSFLMSQSTQNALENAGKMFTQLGRLNVMNPSLPTVVLVGCPNVGKSSLISFLSTAKPETQNYPFTTKSILIGHMTVDGYVVQVADTPGLLNRDDTERKKLEMLTLSVLEHIPDVIVLFVIDPTGYCGTNLSDQLAVRKELRFRYGNIVPSNRWFDVVSKADIWKQHARFRTVNDTETNVNSLREDIDVDSNVAYTTGKQRVKVTSTATPSHPCEETVPSSWSLDCELSSMANDVGTFRQADKDDESCYYFEISSVSKNKFGEESSDVLDVGSPNWALKQGKNGLTDLQNALGWELVQVIEERHKLPLFKKEQGSSDFDSSAI